MRVRSEGREMGLAQVDAAIGSAPGVPGALIAGFDEIREGRGKGGSVIERGVGRRKGVGVRPKRGGVPGEVEPARGPARRVTGARGTGRGWSPRTTGTRRRALGGGKGEGRAFGRRPRGKGGRRGQTTGVEGRERGGVRGTRRGRSRGCRTLGTRQGRGQRGGRGVTGHGDRANGANRGGRSRGRGRGGRSTTNHSQGDGSTPTSRRGRLERGIQPWADLLAESLPLELGQGRDRRVEDLEHVGKENPL